MSIKISTSMILTLSLLTMVLPSRILAQRPALGELIITGEVVVNHIRAASGSTVFSGSEIETRPRGAAVVNFRRGRGVLAIESNARLLLGGTTDRLMARVSHGKITWRTTSPATVITPHLSVESPVNSACAVVVSSQGTEVAALTHPVRVLTGEEVVIVNPGERYLSQTGATAGGQEQQKQKKPQKRRRRILGIVIPLIAGAVAIPLALQVAEGESSPPVSPTTPRP
ncbi:MAG: hypothetical protein D6723_15935 [Acidobacteria bacterium]|nr:MAG: hypothetical protein D6723_15935 [Acidobacteriota bacterium]